MQIKAVKHDEHGTIQEYKLDNDQIVKVSDAISMVKNGQIEGCNVFTTKNGHEAIRSNADGNPDNNLDNLETF